MSDLSEAEILRCLEQNFRLAAEDCDRLAKGERGPVYTRLRQELRLIEGSLRQLMYWRADTRYSRVAQDIAKVQQMSGQFLRDHRKGGPFAKLATILRGYHYKVSRAITTKTGVIGPILPASARAPRPREGQSVSTSGLILPPGFTRQ